MNEIPQWEKLEVNVSFDFVGLLFGFFNFQVVWKGAHLLGCGKTIVNGEPYYIAQMDTPGVIAGVPGFDKSNVGEPKEVSSESQGRGEERVFHKPQMK